MMLGHKVTPKLIKLLGIKVTLYDPACVLDNGIFFVVEEEKNYIKTDKKQGPKGLNMPLFNVDLFKA